MQENSARRRSNRNGRETLRKLYPETDTDATGGSAHIGNDQTAKPTTTVTKDGIETEQTTPGKNAPATTTTGTQQNPPKTTAPTTAATPKTTPAKSSAAPVAGAGSGRWEVRAGTFTYKEGARERLEQVIKMGYTNAEIGKTNGGKYAVVVVLRTNNKAKAIQVGDQLEKRGIDAFVYDRNKKD